MDFKTLLKQFIEALLMPLDYLISPDNRIFVLYLFGSVVMAFFVYRKLNSSLGFFRYLLPKENWISTSARIDYSLWFLNGFIKVFMFSPILVLSVYLQEFTSMGLSANFGPTPLVISRHTAVLLFTIFLWLFGDFSTYLLHLSMHKIPSLWRFHKVHHSATVLNPITLYRIHPVELLLTQIKSILVLGLSTGLFYYLAGGVVGIKTLFGVGIFKFLFFFFGANLRHSHIKFTFPSWLENIIISPFQHQIHHSDKPQHFDKNIGSHLAIWDWLFGTLIKSKQVTDIQFGLGDENKNFDDLQKNIFGPFKKQ